MFLEKKKIYNTFYTRPTILCPGNQQQLTHQCFLVCTPHRLQKAFRGVYKFPSLHPLEESIYYKMLHQFWIATLRTPFAEQCQRTISQDHLLAAKFYLNIKIFDIAINILFVLNFKVKFLFFAVLGRYSLQFYNLDYISGARKWYLMNS